MICLPGNSLCISYSCVLTYPDVVLFALRKEHSGGAAAVVQPAIMKVCPVVVSLSTPPASSFL